jgi:hypothetical protein
MPLILKAALREVPFAAPYRGPASFRKDGYRYENDIHGNISSFHGTEIILVSDQAIYRLYYSGGIVE